MAKITREGVGKVFWWIKTVLGYVFLMASYLFTAIGIYTIYLYIAAVKTDVERSDDDFGFAILFMLLNLCLAFLLVLFRMKDRRGWFLFLFHIVVFVGFFFYPSFFKT